MQLRLDAGYYFFKGPALLFSPRTSWKISSFALKTHGLSNTSDILQNKQNTVWFIGVEVKHETRLNNSC